MIFDLSKAKIFIRPGSTDLRKAVNGLSAIVQELMKQDPFSGSVYLFCNSGRKLLKAVYWDKTGFWLSQKRLEENKFILFKKQLKSKQEIIEKDVMPQKKI